MRSSRIRRLASGAPISAACILAAAAWGQQADGAQDVSGVWWVTKYSPKIEIIGGGDIPYNEKGQAEYRKNIAGLKDGSITDEARRVCVPDGIPRTLEEIGSEMALTPERIRQIEKRALSKLRHPSFGLREEDLI